MWGPKEYTFFDVFLKAFNKNTSITNFHPLGSTSKPLSRSKEPYRRKGKTQLNRQMSLLVSKPTRNFPPNLHWPKAKTTILHLPSKFKNLVLIQNLKKQKTKNSGYQRLILCTTLWNYSNSPIKRRQEWVLNLSHFKIFSLEEEGCKDILKCDSFWKIIILSLTSPMHIIMSCPQQMPKLPAPTPPCG